MDIDLLNEIKTLIGDGLTCPANIQELNKVIELKNKLTKQLNNLYEKINSITNFIDPLDSLIDTTEKAIPPAQLAIDIASNIPSTFASPIPVGPIIAGQKLINKLNFIKGKSKGTIESGKSSLTTLTSELQKVIDLLSMVDLFINLCAQEISKNSNLITCSLPDGSTQPMTEEDCIAAGGTSVDGIGGTSVDGIGGSSDSDLLVQAQVSQELLDSTIQQSNQLSPVVTNVNGFEMGVETEVTDNPLKRRRATAKNTEGVIVLLGEYSYSSNDQILIDELVFYIQQNNLKAE